MIDRDKQKHRFMPLDKIGICIGAILFIIAVYSIWFITAIPYGSSQESNIAITYTSGSFKDFDKVITITDSDTTLVIDFMEIGGSVSEDIDTGEMFYYLN